MTAGSERQGRNTRSGSMPVVKSSAHAQGRGRDRSDAMVFPVLDKAFPVSSPRIPCSDSQGKLQKRPEASRDLKRCTRHSSRSFTNFPVFFPVRQGNWGRRPVRTGLRRQPTSSVSTHRRRYSVKEGAFAGVFACTSQALCSRFRKTRLRVASPKFRSNSKGCRRLRAVLLPTLAA